MSTELMYLHDAYLTGFDAVAVDVRDGAVALDRTLFYPTGGGQPHDVGTLAGRDVVDVRKDGDHVWHSLEGGLFPTSATQSPARSNWPVGINSCALTPLCTCCAV